MLAKIAILQEELINIRNKKLRIKHAEEQIQNKLNEIARELGDENMKKAGIKQQVDTGKLLLNEQMLSKLDKAHKSEKGKEEFLKFLADTPGALEHYMRFARNQ